MAQTTPQQQRKPFNRGFCFLVLISIIVVLGLVVLFTWLALRPKKPVYSIESGSLSDFNLNDIHLNSTFYFTIRTHNPNHRVSIYYDAVNSSVTHHNQSIAFSTIPRFFHRRRNVTDLTPKFVARDVALSHANAADLKQENRTGQVELEVHVTARIRFKAGVFKSRHRTLKVLCVPVMVPTTNSSPHFSPVTCETDLV
ncbi:hypothetical protein SLE2022_001760 [Rubroshorea leprosula]